MESVTNTTLDANFTFGQFDLGPNKSGSVNGGNTVIELISLVLFVAGIFANVLVVFVQASRLTTSTRVYTFSLA